MHAVDTNVLVRLLIGDDEKQAAAAESFLAKSSGGWISHLVLAESVWVLESVYARTAVQIGAALETLLDHASLAVQDPEVVAAALLQFRRHRGVGFSDCLALEIARKAGHLPMATFDKRFGKVSGTRRL
jgi:predicted nucleic-acid-binding protein